VAALSSPSLGAALAVAIALHNVPEGLCVAMPVYYATGSRVKGFLWAFLSGISEPLGMLFVVGGGPTLLSLLRVACRLWWWSCCGHGGGLC
jgi:zinc transporter ZupT